MMHPRFKAMVNESFENDIAIGQEDEHEISWRSVPDFGSQIITKSFPIEARYLSWQPNFS